MKSHHIMFIVLTWLALNALAPLFLNSFERLYQRQIDFVVRGAVSKAMGLLFFLLRLSMIVIMLPTIVLVIIAERLFPKLFRIQFFGDIQYATNLLFKRRLPEVVRAEFREWQAKRKRTNKTPQVTKD